MSISLTRRGRVALAAVAAMAFAGGAGAGAAGADVNANDPALNVPADKIEHVVREFQTTGAYGEHTLQELWLGSDKAHWIARDVTSGKIVRETTFDRGAHQVYDSKDNTLQTGNDGDPTPPWQTLAQEAVVWKDAFAQGRTRQVGETNVFGRRALVLESVRGKWVTDEPSQMTTMTVDAETFTLYDIRTVLPKHDFSQDVAIKSYETLDRAATGEAVFAMSAHDGARVVTASTAGAKARKARPKKAKRHAKHRRKAAKHHH